MNELKARLDRIRSRVTSDEFLTGSGLGNEVPFYAFDYPPPEEPRVAAHVDWLVDDLRSKAGLQVGRVDVFALAIEALNKRGLYEKAVAMEATKGVPALLAALRGPLEPGKLAQALVAQVSSSPVDMVFLTGIGGAYPLVRTHSLLNNLQPVLGSTPLVMFFPGRFSGQTLQLFGELEETPYYRAFRLVD
ncbi:MAG: DUF1788 domain-containing protein [Alphaproteobacteria bacterium]|nr:MAG: DUF1788 domain-containing protein [Alphaproteobacteria bacterium]